MVVVNEDGTKAEGTLTLKKSTQAVQFIQDLVKEGYTTVSPVEKGFETGRVSNGVKWFVDNC